MQLLPDHPEQLKTVSQTLVLEGFCPYHSRSISLGDLGEGLRLLTRPQTLFAGAVNGPVFTYQRLVESSTGRVLVLGEWGNPNVAQQFHQFQAACCTTAPDQECIPDDILPELD